MQLTEKEEAALRNCLRKMEDAFFTKIKNRDEWPVDEPRAYARFIERQIEHIEYQNKKTLEEAPDEGEYLARSFLWMTVYASFRGIDLPQAITNTLRKE